ncbi:sulfite exporter TauE/SafE family protein [Crateriforma spongiae]|uniref:sulfite exporter TauE/SafE family protein n=1 Tax=Crateriforma spongiae TaxID=2724528 RepID=UPI0014462290|nr:sulfite exporter TauE/SafE family protein [Crateriforma spongiae]
MDDTTTMILIATVAAIAGFAHSAIGFGFGIVSLSLLPLIVDVRQSHIVVSTASVPVILMAAWSFRHGLNWRDVRPAVIGAIVFLPIGLMLFELMPMGWLVRVTGLAILLMVLMNYRNRHRKTGCDTDGPGIVPADAATTWPCFIAGGLGGFLAGAVSIAGPPMAAFGLKRGWPAERFKAFMNFYLLVVAMYKVGGMVVRNLIDREALIQACWLAPAAVVGIVVGAKASRHFSNRWTEALVTTSLLAIAVYFIVG